MTVEKRLGKDILPYIFSAEDLRKRNYFRLHQGFVQIGLVLAILTTLGLGTEFVVESARGQMPQATGGPDTAGVLDLSGGNALISCVLALLVIGRTVHEHIRAGQKAILAGNAMLRFRIWNNHLHTVLDGQEQVARLDEIYKQILALVAEGVKDEWWPWPGHAPWEQIKERVEKRMDDLKARHGESWPTQAAPGENVFTPQQRPRDDKENRE